MFGRSREIIYIPDANPVSPLAKIAWVVAGILLVAAIWAQSDDSEPTSPTATDSSAPAVTPTARPTESSATSAGQSSANPAPSPTESAIEKDFGDLFTVVSVTDGDTFRVSYRGSDEPVRLIGVDAPETVDPDEAKQCFGQESADRLRQILTGKKVFLVRDGQQDDRDQYGRLLRFAYLEDRSNVNVALVRGGYATYEEQYPIAEPFRSELAQAESLAVRRNAGLWSQCY